MPEAGAVLEVEDVHTYYGESHVLQGISLRVAASEVLAILGRNGMGKTTLIRSIIGFTPPRRGRVRFKGQDITRWPPYRMVESGMALVPQGRRVFPSLTVRENLEVGAERARAVDSRSRPRALPAAPRARKEPRQQAVGRRAADAGHRTRPHDQPRLLLLDEPTEGLAPTIVEGLIETVESLVDGGMAMVVVEQNLQFATALAERMVVMVAGRVAVETTATVMRARRRGTASSGVSRGHPPRDRGGVRRIRTREVAAATVAAGNGGSQ